MSESAVLAELTLLQRQTGVSITGRSGTASRTTWEKSETNTRVCFYKEPEEFVSAILMLRGRGMGVNLIYLIHEVIGTDY